MDNNYSVNINNNNNDDNNYNTNNNTNTNNIYYLCRNQTLQFIIDAFILIAPFYLAYQYDNEFYNNDPRWIRPLTVLLTIFNPIAWFVVPIHLHNVDKRNFNKDLKLEQIDCLNNIKLYNINFNECKSKNIYCLYNLNKNKKIYKNSEYNCKNRDPSLCNNIITKYNITYNNCDKISYDCVTYLNKNKNKLINIKFECL